MRIQIALFALISALAAPASAQVQIYCDGQAENLNTYLQIHKVLFSDRDVSRVEEFYADEIISHNNDAGGPGSVVKPDDMRKMWESSLKNNPERVLEDELILCVDDFVVVRTVIKSSFNTPLAGYPPTGEPYEITGIDIYRFDDGKVVERWGNADVAFIFRQLGFKMVKEDE
ncbi:MAG: SnoaL-like domain-containing protein [Rhodospirillaceae bacterium]|jgi:predicted ester cyclase|nr:SnoaL-like domain-containing protein [Rhodospirillaceae bacterium]MBT5565508.1 SnoaL-like domain-containing protein [Rhodospirillaceae bacterium]MBT6089838.1 SnoaL-like domain-containing protein [Rhodospirillaceae bacterium]